MIGVIDFILKSLLNR